MKSFDQILASSSTSLLLFGGSGGTTAYEIQDVGDKIVRFRGSAVLDSIQIGNTVYGGPGGQDSGIATLPSNGQFSISKLEAISYEGYMVINYFEAEIGGTFIKVGTQNSGSVNLNGTNLTVKFSGIKCGAYIDQIVFEVIS